MIKKKGPRALTSTKTQVSAMCTGGATEAVYRAALNSNTANHISRLLVAKCQGLETEL